MAGVPREKLIISGYAAPQTAHPVFVAVKHGRQALALWMKMSWEFEDFPKTNNLGMDF
jgi:hypothetical protein